MTTNLNKTEIATNQVIGVGISSSNKNIYTKKVKNDALTEQPDNNDNTYLNIITIRKILKKFLIEKNMSQEKLANLLEITPNELEKLLICNSSQETSELIKKINLPLIKLFCETKFNS